MTNTSKFWTVALIAGAVGIGAAVANRDQVEEAVPQMAVAAAAPEIPEPTVTKAALPMPKPRKVAEPLVMSSGLAAIVRPLLQRGTDLTMASQGFETSESFVATAHAAKNLGIPFVVLKDRVVAQKMSLAEAIKEIKPDVNAKAEATRATNAAREEISRPS
jgi:hypothetical protein